MALLTVAGWAVAAVAFFALPWTPRDPDRIAQVDLQAASLAARVLRARDGDQVAITPEALSRIDRNLVFVPLDDAGENAIGVASGPEGILLITRSGSGTWFCIADHTAPDLSTRVGSGTVRTAVDTLEACAARSWD